MFPNLTAYHIHYPGTPLPPVKAAYGYILAANGVFVRARSPLLNVTIPVLAAEPQPLGIRGLAPLAPRVQIAGDQRAPTSLLTTLVQHARAQREPGGLGLVEALYRLCLEPDGTLRLVVPVQRASPARVQSLGDGGPQVLAEIHSHGRMGAFWSLTDDADELGFRLYGVVGLLDTVQPALRLRVGVYGHFWEAPLTTLFDDDEAAIQAALAAGVGVEVSPGAE